MRVTFKDMNNMLTKLDGIEVSYISSKELDERIRALEKAMSSPDTFYVGTVYDKDYDRLGIGSNASLAETVFDSRESKYKDAKWTNVTGTLEIETGHVLYRTGNLYVYVDGYDDAGTKQYASQALCHLSTDKKIADTRYSKGWSCTLPSPMFVVIRVDGNVGDPSGSNAGGNNTIDIGIVRDVILNKYYLFSDQYITNIRIISLLKISNELIH